MKKRIMLIFVFLIVQRIGIVSVAGQEDCEEFVSPTATVAIHVSETTKALWNSLGSPHNEWNMWHIYGFLMEQFRADGTPFAVVSDADIGMGFLMNGQMPRYAIVFSLANDCISNETALKIKEFVFAGGHAFVGSTSWTRNENGVLRNSPVGKFFALSTEMGLMAGTPILIGDCKRTGVDSPLVSHLENDSVVRGWKLARNAGANGFYHPTHWAVQVQATTATVLAATGNGDPILTTRRYGNGCFIYHSEFNPLAGYSMHTVANFTYGFYRKAIEEAHAELAYPLVRLGAWPWPCVAGFMTRHDHFSNLGFDGIAGTGDDSEVARIEALHGVHGSHLLRTNVALPNSGENCTDPYYGKLCDEIVRINLLVMDALGAEIGSHTTDESVEPSQANVAQSLNRLEAFLGYRPNTFVAPGGCGFRDTTLAGLVNEGILVSGDMAFGPHPHFALRIDTAAEYNEAARWPLVEIPATGYYSTPDSGAFAGGIFAHEITSNPPACNNDGTIRNCMEKAADFQYNLGGLINLYDHIGDTSLANPTSEQFTAYIDYVQSLPYVYTTSMLDIHQWWLRRDAVRLSTTYITEPEPQITIDVTCTDDSGPFSIEVDLPWPGGAAVTVNGAVSGEYVLHGNRIRVKATAPSQVVLTPAPVCREAISGDLNGDCVVDLADFVILVSQWLECRIEPSDSCFVP